MQDFSMRRMQISDDLVSVLWSLLQNEYARDWLIGSYYSGTSG